MYYFIFGLFYLLSPNKSLKYDVNGVSKDDQSSLNALLINLMLYEQASIRIFLDGDYLLSDLNLILKNIQMDLMYI
jgi:hypothetical protein